MGEKKVVVGVIHKGRIVSELGEFLFQVRMPEEYLSVTLHTKSSNYEPKTKLVEEGLKRDNIEWFFLLEQNQILSPWAPKYLISMAEKENIKILSPVVFSLKANIPVPILHDITETVHLTDIISSGLHEMDYISTKCILIHRSVFEEINQPYFEGQTGKIFDTDFSEKIQKAGFRSYITEDIIVDDMKQFNLKNYYELLERGVEIDEKEISEELHQLIKEEL